ncbi:MAG: hypothetical protein Q7S79_00455 [bacterium]|nr:hypothetical protein [bacterium]
MIRCERGPAGIPLPFDRALGVGWHMVYRGNMVGWYARCIWEGFVPEKVMDWYPGAQLWVGDDGRTVLYSLPNDRGWKPAEGEEINARSHPLHEYGVSFDPEYYNPFK